MAALLPIIKDLAPLVLPSKIHIKRATELQPQPPPSTGRISTIPAITGVSKEICASVLTLPPQTRTSIRHHGEADTILNVLSNNCTLLTCPHSDGIAIREVLGAGDFVLIPAWTEYQLLNESFPVEGSQPAGSSGEFNQIRNLSGGGAFNEHRHVSSTSNASHSSTNNPGLTQDPQPHPFHQLTSTSPGIIMEDHDTIPPTENAWASETHNIPSITQAQPQAPILKQPIIDINQGRDCVLTLTSSQSAVEEIVELKGWGKGVKR